jgi:hypothetical protein
LMRGPFPGTIDPWAEAGRYFQQIHAGIIGSFLETLQQPLLKKGYLASRETSLQVAERREPDIAIQLDEETSKIGKRWDYVATAAALLVEPGIAVSWETPELEAVYIKRLEPYDLVTVIEVVSPSNKADQKTIREYEERRNDLLSDKTVNVVEIDLTRSIKHLLNDVLTTSYAYHIGIHLPREVARLLGWDFGDTLKPFALPLHEEAIVVETQPLYEFGYRYASIAAQMRKERFYTEDNLPFPTLLTGGQRRDALHVVEVWQEELERLSKS